jgi:hypothetical protein
VSATEYAPDELEEVYLLGMLLLTSKGRMLVVIIKGTGGMKT